MSDASIADGGKQTLGNEQKQMLFDNRALGQLIGPLVVEQVLLITVGVVATMMVASVGEDAMSGVALVDSILILFIGAFGALATGGAVIAGQYLGQRNRAMALKATTQIIWFNTILSVLIMLLMYAGKTMIIQRVFGAVDESVLVHANMYLSIVIASIPFVALYNSGAAIFRSMGNSKVPMLISALMNIINIISCLITIFVFGWGVAGAAISILVSRAAAAIVITILLLNQKNDLYLPRTFRYRPEWSMIKRTMMIGIPNGLENSMFQVGKIILLGLIASLGTYSIAANSLGGSIANFQLFPGVAMSLAITPIVARCKGAGEHEQAVYYTKKLVKLAMLFMFIVNIIVILFLPQILGLYNLSDITMEYTRQIIIFVGITSSLVWPLSFIVPASLRAAGDVKVVMLIALATMWIFRIGASYFIVDFLGVGVMGIWIAMISDWFMRAVLMGLRYRAGKWKKIRSI